MKRFACYKRTCYPLEPPELVKALFLHLLDVEIPTSAAKLLHYTTGFLFYPLGYYGWTRGVKSFGMPTDGWVWGTITYFIALAILAPLAGLPFLLNDVPRLSLMSLVGHAVYGYLSAYVFERLEGNGEVTLPAAAHQHIAAIYREGPSGPSRPHAG
jgi:hypothetical protein